MRGKPSHECYIALTLSISKQGILVRQLWHTFEIVQVQRNLIATV